MAHAYHAELGLPDGLGAPVQHLRARPDRRRRDPRLHRGGARRPRPRDPRRRLADPRLVLRRRHGRGRAARRSSTRPPSGRASTSATPARRSRSTTSRTRIKRLTGCPGEIRFVPLALHRRRAPHPERRRRRGRCSASRPRSSSTRGSSGRSRGTAPGSARRRDRHADPARPARRRRGGARRGRGGARERPADDGAAGRARSSARSRAPSGRPTPSRVSSGTAALHLALLALGIGPGDEVIVPAYTFPATANAVELCGARAVLVDVDPETFLVRPELVAEAVTPRTRAVLAVHLFGRPVAWEELQTAVPQEVVAGRGRRRRARGELPRDAVRRARAARLPLVPPAQDRHDRRGRRRDDGRGGARGRGPPPAPPRDRRAATDDIAGPGLQLPAPRRPLRARDPAARAPREPPRRPRARRRLVRRAARAPRPDARRRTRATGTAGRRTSSRSTAATRRSQALRAEGIEAQIGTYAVHRLAAYRDRGSFPGADAAFARALALPFATTMTEDDVDRVSAALARYA